VTGFVSTSTTGGFSIRDLTNVSGNNTNNYVPPAGGSSTFGTSATTTQTTVNTNTNSNSNTPSPTTNQSSNTTNPQSSTVGASD
ncbi:hypothetical protein M3M33_15635, partial [Loigolactobacillus coryniformis]|uniref:hypothetical protein n=1 Tax=Loigolactobacillus coryniformis TaxID=1610 RepID=UPI00201ADFEB